MTMQSEMPQIFVAYYTGENKFPYSPIKTNLYQDRYVGFFVNSLGEKWAFVYDPELGGGILLGNDCNWDVIPLGNGNAPITNDVTLGEDEGLWIRSCWLASSDLRKRDENRNVPLDALTLGIAAISWGISGNTVKKDANERRLSGKKFGNVWITTLSAMTKTYGVPKKNQPISREIGEEVDRLNKQDTEEIRRKLMKE
jgi:hypothetical protein